MVAYVNAIIVQPDHLIPDGILVTEGDKIVDLGQRSRVSIPPGATTIDLGGAYLGPGLIDIHAHAGDQVYFFEDPQRASAYHLQAGTTTILPALYYNMTKEAHLAAIDLIKAQRKTGSARIIDGLYMEGPYLNPAFGAEAENNRWTGEIRREDYMDILRSAAELARVYCIAPERKGIDGYVSDVKSLSPNAIFSVAHSMASPAQIERFLPDGLRLATHHTNATGDLPKYPECRGVCVDETVNYNDDIYAELICDSKGIHVDPYMLRLVLKIKGKDRIILISDHFACDGPIPPGYEGVDDINFDFSGEIAGSKLSLSRACRNMLIHTGASICDVFRFASLNPARLLGLHDRGIIRKGAKANLIAVDHLMNIKKVIFQGQEV